MRSSDVPGFRLFLFGAMAMGTLFSLSACHGPGEDSSFQWTSTPPAGARVHLRTGAGDITVHRTPGAAVVVNGDRHWKRGRSSDVAFTVNQIGNDYYVCAMWRNSGKCGDGTYRGRSTGGFLTMFSLFHRSTDATADLIANIPDGVVLDVRTTNGSVTIDGAASGVTGQTTNGSVTASNVSGPVALLSTNGDVRLTSSALAPTDSVRLSTTNGSIHAELPPGVEGAFDRSTVNGTVQTDYALPQTGSRRGRHLTGQIGASTRVIKARSVNGMISITTRGAAAQH